MLLKSRKPTRRLRVKASKFEEEVEISVKGIDEIGLDIKAKEVLRR